MSNHNAVTQTARLILRAPTDADLDALFDIYSDPATQCFNPMGAMTGREAAGHMLWRWQLHWMRYGFGIWAVALREAPEQMIGFGGTAWRDSGAGEQLMLHIHLRACASGLGIATELGDAAMALAECHAPYAAVRASVVPAHQAAVRVLCKLGFRAAGEVQDLPWSPAKTLYVAETLNVQPLADAPRAVRLAGRQVAPIHGRAALPVATNHADEVALLAR